MNLKKYFNQKGQIALLVTIVFLIVILSIGIGLVSVNIKEMGMASEREESAKALAAAETGIEFALYKINNKESLGDWLCDNNEWFPLDEGKFCLEYTGDPEEFTSVGANSDETVIRRVKYFKN